MPLSRTKAVSSGSALDLDPVVSALAAADDDDSSSSEEGATFQSPQHQDESADDGEHQTMPLGSSKIVLEGPAGIINPVNADWKTPEDDNDSDEESSTSSPQGRQQPADPASSGPSTRQPSSPAAQVGSTPFSEDSPRQGGGGGGGGGGGRDRLPCRVQFAKGPSSSSLRTATESLHSEGGKARLLSPSPHSAASPSAASLSVDSSPARSSGQTRQQSKQSPPHYRQHQESLGQPSITAARRSDSDLTKSSSYSDCRPDDGAMSRDLSGILESDMETKPSRPTLPGASASRISTAAVAAKLCRLEEITQQEDGELRSWKAPKDASGLLRALSYGDALAVEEQLTTTSQDPVARAWGLGSDSPEHQRQRPRHPEHSLSGHLFRASTVAVAKKVSQDDDFDTPSSGGKPLPRASTHTEVSNAHGASHGSNACGVMPLMLSASRGNARMVRVLLERRADVEDRTPAGRTPLMLAAIANSVDCVVVCTEFNADLEAKLQCNGQTALMLAARHNCEATTRALISAKADLEARSHSGHTALNLVALHGVPRTASLLIEAGASLETLDNAGDTPLFNACQMQHLAVVKLLLDKKAEPFKSRGFSVLLEETPIHAAEPLLSQCLSTFMRVETNFRTRERHVCFNSLETFRDSQALQALVDKYLVTGDVRVGHLCNHLACKRLLHALWKKAGAHSYRHQVSVYTLYLLSLSVMACNFGSDLCQSADDGRMQLLAIISIGLHCFCRGDLLDPTGELARCSTWTVLHYCVKFLLLAMLAIGQTPFGASASCHALQNQTEIEGQADPSCSAQLLGSDGPGRHRVEPRLAPDMISLVLVLLASWLSSAQYLLLLQIAGWCPGTYLRAVWAMLSRVAEFALVYSLIVTPYTLATYLLFRDELEDFRYLGRAFLTLMESTVTGGDYRAMCSHSAIGCAIHFSFLILGTLLLLNMVVAMITNSFDATRDRAEADHAVHRARFILAASKDLQIDLSGYQGQSNLMKLSSRADVKYIGIGLDVERISEQEAPEMATSLAATGHTGEDSLYEALRSDLATLRREMATQNAAIRQVLSMQHSGDAPHSPHGRDFDAVPDQEPEMQRAMSDTSPIRSSVSYSFQPRYNTGAREGARKIGSTRW